MTCEERSLQPLHLIEHVEVDWRGHEDLIVELLRTRDIPLADAIIDAVTRHSDSTSSNGYLEVGSVDWVLDWLAEEEGVGLPIASVCCFPGAPQGPTRRALVEEFNREDSRHRGLLASHILPHFVDLTTDEFSESALSFLLSDLSRTVGAFELFHNLLARTATDRFVNDRLLPILSGASQDLAKKIRQILRQIGARHGRRYGVEWDLVEEGGG